MTDRWETMPSVVEERVRGYLDRLAGVVAAATDADDRITAHRIVRRLETALDVVEGQAPLPPAPVLARRFAQLHRRALEQIQRCPGALAAQLLPTPERARAAPEDLIEGVGGRAGVRKGAGAGRRQAGLRG